MTASVTIPYTNDSAPAADHPMGVVDHLLRDSGGFLDRIEEETNPLPIAKTLIVTIVVATAVFGGAIGAYRMGLQPLFAAVKLPLVMLLTAGMTAPAFTGLVRAAQPGRSITSVMVAFRTDLVLILASLAMTSLVLAALAPVIMLGVMLGASYHGMVLLVVSCCIVGGLVGIILFLRGLARRSARGQWMAALASLALFAVVGSQMAWTLRPFVARPRADVTFVRAIEGSFIDAVATSFNSARGIYTRDSAPLPME